MIGGHCYLVLSIYSENEIEAGSNYIVGTIEKDINPYAIRYETIKTTGESIGVLSIENGKLSYQANVSNRYIAYGRILMLC